MSKMWGGRFRGALDPLMARLNRSLDFDRRLWRADIRGSQAYAQALAKAGVITLDEARQLQEGLDMVQQEFEAGQFLFQNSDEDIHTAVERRLKERIGEAAGKLHTGRSRNDQVATDMRLFVLEAIAELDAALAGLQNALVERAEEALDIILPGYTHLQRAQPVTLAHWLLAYFWMFARDHDRLMDLRRRTAVLPLGSGALAGHPFGIDRQYLAELLGFPTIAPNSMDAVADRDFVVETLFWGAVTQMHLSRLAEDLIIWCTAEFGFVRLSDAYSTGSSLMPQKRNPDSLELIRGKSGRVFGNLMALLTTLKGLPMTYNKDMQEDKEPLFDTIDTVRDCLMLAAGVVRTLSWDADAMRRACSTELLATDLADYLVRKGVPFRTAHALVGRAVQRAEERGVTLQELSLEEYRAVSPAFEADLYDALSVEASVTARSTEGGTAPEAVRRQLEEARRLLASRAVAASQKFDE
ncbi:MAG: argininosuccinate lyase [Anaerolineae bacterium]